MATKTRSRTSTRVPGQSVDYVAVAIAYAEDASEDSKGRRYGKRIRQAAKRFLKDLKRAQKPRSPFVWSPPQAVRACRFIEKLPHVEGVWSTATLLLEPAQVFFLVQLFGFRTPAGGRRFTTALFAIARKNAKSTLAAGILLYCLCEESEPGPQILSAATTGDQARIVWNIAKRMVERTPALREHYGVEAFANTVVRYGTSGVMKPINAKASTQDGLNPSALCFDELHAHKTPELLNVLTSAAGARANPLFLYTTTEGYETPGPWPEIRKFSENVLDGVVTADHFLAIFYCVDEKDDDFDEAAWIKANPLIEGNPLLLDVIRREAIEAKSIPSKFAEFQIKRLNRRASSSSGFVNLRKWNGCAAVVSLDAMVGVQCWAGLDLATTTDMAAWRLLWLKDDVWYTWGRYWVPAEAVRHRTERRTVPYAGWVAAGHVTETSGDAVDYAVIEQQIVADFARFQPGKIAYDPWNAMQLATRLTDQGLPLEAFIQGPRSYHPAMQAFEIAYTTGALRHDGNPVLTWNMANLVARHDVNLNMAPDRKRSADKIDGAAALFMAFGVAVGDVDGRSFEAFLRNPVSA